MVRRWQQVSLEEAKQHPLYGIKNWLAVFAFAVLLIPLREFGGLRGAAYDAGMTLTQFLSYNEAFGTYAKIVLALETLMAAVIFWCPRRLNIEPPCRSNIEPGRVAGFQFSNCG